MNASVLLWKHPQEKLVSEWGKQAKDGEEARPGYDLRQSPVEGVPWSHGRVWASARPLSYAIMKHGGWAIMFTLLSITGLGLRPWGGGEK